MWERFECPPLNCDWKIIISLMLFDFECCIYGGNSFLLWARNEKSVKGIFFYFCIWGRLICEMNLGEQRVWQQIRARPEKLKKAPKLLLSKCVVAEIFRPCRSEMLFLWYFQWKFFIVSFQPVKWSIVGLINRGHYNGLCSSPQAPAKVCKQWHFKAEQNKTKNPN